MEDLLQKLQNLSKSELLSKLQVALREPLYLVGGAVRDLALGRECHDLDLASALPPDVAKERLGDVRVVDTGLQHGTITIVLGDEHVELTTFRKPSARTESCFSESIEEDLSGRDFTINAVAYDLQRNVIIDPYQGLKDLKNKILTTVGDASHRFKEDPLRILRMVRFGTAAGFKIEENVLAAAKLLGKTISTVSPERIKDEFSKILVSDFPASAFETLRECELFQYFLPEIIPAIGFEQNEYHIHDVYGHTLDVIERTPKNLTLRLAGLFHDLGKPLTLSIGEDGRRHFYCHEQESVKICKTVMQRLKYSNAEIQRVTLLVAEHMRPINCGPAGIRRLFRDLGDTFDEWLQFKYADMSPSMDELEFKGQMDGFMQLVQAEREKMAEPSYGKLALTGDDILRHGVPAGPRVGKILRQLEECVIEDPALNTREALQKLLDEIIRKERLEKD